MKMRNLSIVLLVAILGALVLTACGGTVSSPSATPAGTTAAKSPKPDAGQDWQAKWNDMQTAARKEGKLTIYGELGPEAKAGLSKPLKEKFGIELDSVVGSGAQVAAKYVQETRVGVYLADILFTGSPTFLNTVKPNVTLAPLAPVLVLPEIQDPKVWPEGGIPYLDKDRLIVQSTLGVNPFAIINTDMVKPGELTSYEDYLNPKWKGKIVLFDPTIAGSTAAFFTLILQRIYGPEEGRKYLTKLAEQEPVIVRDKRLPVEWVAKGKYAIHMSPNMQSTMEFVDAGAPIQTTREKEGLYINASSSCFALVEKPAHPDAARVVVNWLLTAEAGAILSKAWAAPAARRDVPTTGLNPMFIPLPGEKLQLTTEDLVLYTPKAQQIAGEIFAKYLK